MLLACDNSVVSSVLSLCSQCFMFIFVFVYVSCVFLLSFVLLDMNHWSDANKMNEWIKNQREIESPLLLVIKCQSADGLRRASDGRERPCDGHKSSRCMVVLSNHWHFKIADARNGGLKPLDYAANASEIWQHHLLDACLPHDSLKCLGAEQIINKHNVCCSAAVQAVHVQPLYSSLSIHCCSWIY